MHYSSLLQRAVGRTTNCHPVSSPGVHAEAGPVPAEHLSGPVPAAAPQEGPHIAQVHRRRNVRAVTNNIFIQIRTVVWRKTIALTQKDETEKAKYTMMLFLSTILYQMYLASNNY